MSKSNKQYRTIDEKQHHTFKAKKKKTDEKRIKTIDRTLKNKKYEMSEDDGGSFVAYY